VPISPAVQKEFDNGGLLHGVLTFPDEDADEDEGLPECELQTTDNLPGTQSLNNLASANKYKRKWQEEMPVGALGAKILSKYVFKVTDRDYSYKSLTGVRMGDHQRLMSALPNPFVKDKLFATQGFAKFRHPVHPAGMDADTLSTYKIPTADLKASDDVAKTQLEARERLADVATPCG
jgi:hypothetical protein